MNVTGRYGALSPARYPHLYFLRRTIAAQTGTPAGTLKNIAHGLPTDAGALFCGGAMDIGSGNRIWISPLSAGRFMIFDWSTDTLINGPLVSDGGASSNAYTGIVAVDEDLMIAIPRRGGPVGVINPRTRTLSPGPVVAAGVDNAFGSGCLTGVGLIVVAPKTFGNILVIDPATMTARNLAPNPSPTTGGVFNGYSTAIALDGPWALLIPDGTAPLVKVNAMTGQVVASVSPTLVQCKGAVTLPDGRVRIVSHAGSRLLTYDPKTHTYKSSDAQIGSGNKFWGGNLLPDGKEIYAPYDFGAPLIVDPATDTWTSGPAISGTNLSGGSLALPDGRSFFIAYRSPNFTLYTHQTGGQPLPRDALTSRYLNTAF